MKIIHLADTHLGFTAYRKISESGYNQREEDLSFAFQQAVDKILEIKPDLVLHCGDLFDSVRPTNRILHFAITQILRLIQAGIPTIIISGNHDTPKQRYLGSVFSIFEALPLPENLLYVIYKNKYETIQLTTHPHNSTHNPQPTTIHTIPQCSSDEIFKQELNRVELKPGKNILMLHAGVTGMKEFSHGDFNELLVDARYFEEKNFDYAALGHYHGQACAAKNAWFAGSTERLSFSEAGQAKGFLEIILESEIKVISHEIETRPMIDLPSIDAYGKDSSELSALIEERILNINPNGKILRLKVSNIPPAVFSTLDIKKLRELTAAAAHFEPVFEKSEEAGKVESIKTSIGGLNEEYISFIESYPNLDSTEKEEFKILGQDYLSKVTEEEEA